jgi:ADP-ribose pyrophosphatase
MRAHGPWKIHDTFERFTDEFIQVYEDRVTRPNGEPGSYATVTVKRGVAVLAIDEKGDAHLTRQFRYAVGHDSVEVASGGVEDGEEPLESARRELREELGLVATEWSDLGLIDTDTSIVRCPVWLFVARGLQATGTDQDATESIQRVALPFARVVEMVMNGAITHAPSCCVILKAAWHDRHL